ncbi:MAG: TonB-dependent receptor plug domain-containing protein [Deltaproteobacteria bacterium]|jgi:iron complex outermembrane receptor protein|nr:TonB-dependent receptor plug domain-containing protein [Deltaproteobacteria bacterium]
MSAWVHPWKLIWFMVLLWGTMGEFWFPACFLTVRCAQAAETGQVLITRQDIADLKANRLADVLNTVPGVSAASSSVSIHGSYKVRVFLDGSLLNDPTSSHGGIDFDRVSLSQVEKIEILTDAGSLSYGQDASGGVILITSREIDQTSGFIRFYGGSQGHFFSEFDASLSQGPWGLGLRGGWERSDGFKVNNDREKHRVGLSVSRRSAQAGLAVAIDHQTEDQGFSGLPNFPTPYSRQKSRNFNLAVNGDYQNFELAAAYFDGRSENRDPSRSLYQTLRVIRAGGDLRYSASLGSEDAVLGRVGLNLGTGLEETRAISSDFGSRSENVIHFYGALAWPIPKLPLELSAGMRANFNSGFEDSFNPELTVTYRAQLFQLSYRYSRAANTPTFQQRFGRSSSTEPNPGLGIETANNHAVSLILNPHPAFGFHLTGYRNALKGRITYVRAASSPVGRYQNVGRATFTGLDLGFDWTAASYLAFKGSFSMLRAEDCDLGKLLPAQPKTRARLEMTVRPLEGLTLVGSLDYSGYNFTDRLNTVRLGGRVLTGLRAEYAIGRYSLFFEAENLFDRDYYYVDGLLAPPLVWFVGLGVTF